MNLQTIEIKEKRNSFLLKGFIYLALTVISLFIALMPYIFVALNNDKMLYFLIGGVAFVGFTMTFVLHLYNEICPRNVLVITEKGFTDFLNIGDYEIEWTNVASVKLIGKTDAQYLGISLENSDLVIENIKQKFADSIRSNLDDNLPAIIIDADNIRFSLTELKEIFTAHVKDARKVTDDFSNRPKNNPFTTDDVLRAFGKLSSIETPATETNETNEKNIIEEHSVSDSDVVTESNDFYDALTSIAFSENELDRCGADSAEIKEPSKDTHENPSDDNDVIIDLNSTRTFEPLDIESTHEEGSNDNIIEEDHDEEFASEESIQEKTTETEVTSASEIDDILSRVKSSKISELEIILAEKDVPFSFARVDKNEKEDISKEPECSHTVYKELNFDVSSEVNKNEPIPTDDFNTSLDELIKIALNEPQKDLRPSSTKLSEEDAYPDLINLNDDNSDYGDIIIPKFD